MKCLIVCRSPGEKAEEDRRIDFGTNIRVWQRSAP
jgi:hypothetical protein